MDEDAKGQMNKTFPQELLVAEKGYFCGEFLFSEIGSFSKSIIKRMAGTDKGTPNINYENIDEFAKK